MGHLRTQATSYHYHQLLHLYIFVKLAMDVLYPDYTKILQILLFFCFPVNILAVPFNSETFYFFSPLSGIHSDFWHAFSQICAHCQCSLAIAFHFLSHHHCPLLSYSPDHSAPISQQFSSFSFLPPVQVAGETDKGRLVASTQAGRASQVTLLSEMWPLLKVSC